MPFRLIRFWLVAVNLLAALLLAGCGELAFTAGPLLYNVEFSASAISPNADGVDDVTEITYSLRRPADVSIYFENEQGQRFYFRDTRRRSPGDYSVLWGGVVDDPEIVDLGYGPVEVVSRVLSDGTYTWTVEATGDAGQREAVSGQITLHDADTELPELHNFAVVPDTFRPNQDGLRDDWVSISYYLSKEANDVLLYLVDPEQPAVRIFISEAPGLVKPTEQGYHEYRYEGGVDLNAEPPPDGTYNIVG
ncbi:MAG: hypothetical protein H3C34_29515, partial [Caldilineaceae bacterium]|nr:hypothetical protein [Caldilineaceae bacterium]